ncbi:hypothetical protein JTB14_017072 [Gonioctena quinquepunctata]|nr:hypothetical protein JTB14_017072 [Gonioctena quinquepunctata]
MNEPNISEQGDVSQNDIERHMKVVIHNFWLSKWRNSRTQLKEIKREDQPRNNISHQRKHPSSHWTHQVHLLMREEEEIFDMCQPSGKLNNPPDMALHRKQQLRRDASLGNISGEDLVKSESKAFALKSSFYSQLKSSLKKIPIGLVTPMYRKLEWVLDPTNVQCRF